MALRLGVAGGVDGDVAKTFVGAGRETSKLSKPASEIAEGWTVSWKEK